LDDLLHGPEISAMAVALEFVVIAPIATIRRNAWGMGAIKIADHITSD